LMTDLKTFSKEAAELTDAALRKILPAESVYPESIHSLMRYSIFAGGKRIRPCLLLASHVACGGKMENEQAVMASAAVEMFHTFSLIHDDLPCMDDDDFRRGKPTAHKAFTEALAVLGGDALCILAFEVLTRTGRVDIINEIAIALGTQGMLGGQVVDIESEGKNVTKNVVEYIHNNKTAALIRSTIRIGAMLANAPAQALEKLSTYGNLIGLAFQVVDDILDEESTTETLGKDAGSDREKGKATFPAVIGMQQSKQYADDLIRKAIESIAFLDEKGTILRELAQYIRDRIS
jgi:geranylgeranyl diphosphate synthase, type II